MKRRSSIACVLGGGVLARAALVLIALAAPARAQEATAVLVIGAPGDGGARARLNRELPAGVPVKIQVPVPVADPSKGTLTIWPTQTDQCVDPLEGATQRRQFGMSVAGGPDARVLEATISPLQIATRYCFHVVYERGLSADRLAALSDMIAGTRIDWQDTCVRPPDEQTERVRARLAARLAESLGALREQRGAADASPDLKSVARSVPRQIDEAAAALAALLDVPGRCNAITARRATEERALDEQQAATRRQGQAAAAVRRLPTAIKAWPAVVVPSGPSFLVWRLVDVLNQPSTINGIVAHVDLADHQLAMDLGSLADPAVTDAAGKREALRGRLGAAPPAPLPIVVFLPSLGKSVTVASLLADSGAADFAGLLSDLASRREAILPQLELLGRQDKAVAETWTRALAGLAEEAAAALRAVKAYREARDAREGAEAEIPRALKLLVQGETVRSLLRKTEVVLDAPRAALRETDDKASWISPVVGIMAAAPLLAHQGKLADPWLVPYVGASVYFKRVDRVIDVGQLVGDTFWQRNSFSAGALLARPDVRGKAVTGPWRVELVPFLGFGHRFTQYLRGDVGLVPFQYVDRIPVIVERRWGVAGWLGVAIDADVWAIFSGKLGR